VNALLLILVIAVTLAAAALAMLVLVIAGIHGEERRLNLSGPARTRTGHVTRRVLNVHISQPDALHAFASRTPAPPPPAPSRNS
jgi:hypothetical protein